MENRNVKFYVGAALTVVGIAFIFVGIAQGNQEGLVQTSSAAQIPAALVEAFNGLVIGLVTAAFVWILGKVGLDLLSLAVPLGLTLSTFLVGIVQGWINLQPISSDPWIMMAFNVLLVVFVGTGGLALLAKHRGSNTLL